MAATDRQGASRSPQSRDLTAILCIVSHEDLLAGYRFALQQVDARGQPLNGLKEMWETGTLAQFPNSTGMVVQALNVYGPINKGVVVWGYKAGLRPITGFCPLGPTSVRDQYYLVSPAGRDFTIARATQSTSTTTAPSWNTSFGFTGSVGTPSDAPVNVQGGGNLGFTRNGEQRSNAQQQGTTETESTRLVKSLGVEFRAGPPSFSSLQSSGTNYG